MSILNNAFWHKGQRDVVGSRVIQPSTIAANSNDLVTGAEVLWYTIASTAGQSYSKAAASAIDLSALTALHEIIQQLQEMMILRSVQYQQGKMHLVW